jgi:hypothetical protein
MVPGIKSEEIPRKEPERQLREHQTFKNGEGYEM